MRLETLQFSVKGLETLQFSVKGLETLQLSVKGLETLQFSVKGLETLQFSVKGLETLQTVQTHLAALFRFWSRLNAEPVFKASIKLSITPSWFPSLLKSTKAFFLATLSALSYKSIKYEITVWDGRAARCVKQKFKTLSPFKIGSFSKLFFSALG